MWSMRSMRLLPLILLALFALPAPAHAIELAVQDDAVLLHRSYADAALALDRAVEMNAERVRVNLSWSGSMPEEQAEARRRPEGIFWDFSRLERLHEDATARGLQLQVTLTGPAPAWATSDRKVGNVRPDAAAFGQFARAAAEAFAGRIDRWSIWNEPNWHRLLGPAKSAPAIYRGLFRSGQRAIAQADPDAEILIGEMMPGANTKKSTPALKFLRALTCSRSDWKAAKRCSGLKADGFALHPYQFARRPRDAKPANRDVVEIGSLSRLTSALDKLRARRALVTPSGGRMPLYLTEFGYFTDGPLARSETTHARWMTEAWNIAARNPRVRQLLQYLMVDPWPEHVSWRSAVLERDGSPRPVFDALRELASSG
jgi:hypothetical protein